MSLSLWIALGVAITVVLLYLLCMQVLVRRSRELDAQVVYSRIRPWKDDAGKD
jgi:hypothetical protein